VIGGNGAGKSTLLNAIAGEVQVDTGNVVIDGADVTALPTHRRASAVARVFQDPLVGTAGAMTIEENLALAERRGQHNGLRSGLSGAARQRYRDRLATLELGLEMRMGQKVELLSGGQRQSLALLMAVLRTPKLLLLDEHTAALDPKTADTVMRATLDAVARDRLTTLMVTHNMAHALGYGSRLFMMAEGRIVFEADAAEKKTLTVESLIRRFQVTSDRMLLG
jgi:putative ABC transport system ATP-binding protein